MIQFDENALQQVAQGTQASPVMRGQRSRNAISIPFRKAKGDKEEVQSKLAKFVTTVQKQQSPKITDGKAAAAAVVEAAGEASIAYSGLARSVDVATHVVGVAVADKDVLLVTTTPVSAVIAHSQLLVDNVPCRLVKAGGSDEPLTKGAPRTIVVVDAESLLASFLRGGVCARLSIHFSHMIIDRSVHTFSYSTEMLLSKMRPALQSNNSPQIFICGLATSHIERALKRFYQDITIAFPFSSAFESVPSDEAADNDVDADAAPQSSGPAFTVLTEDDVALLAKLDVASPPQGREVSAALREAPPQQQSHAITMTAAVLKSLAALHTDDTAPLVVQVITGNSRFHETKLAELCAELPVSVCSKFTGAIPKMSIIAVVTPTPSNVVGRHAVIDLGTEYVIRPGTSAVTSRAFDLLSPKACWALRENVDQRRALCDQTALYRTHVLGEKSDCLYVQLFPSNVIRPARSLDSAGTSNKPAFTLFQEYPHPTGDHAVLLRMERLNMSAAVMVPYLPSAFATHKGKLEALGFTNQHGFSIKGDICARLSSVLGPVEVCRFVMVAAAIGLAEEGLAVATGMMGSLFVKGATGIHSARDTFHPHSKSDHVADALIVSAVLKGGFTAVKKVLTNNEAIASIDASGCGAIPTMFANARHILNDYSILPATTDYDGLSASLIKNAQLIGLLIAESYFQNAAAGRLGRSDLRLLIAPKDEDRAVLPTVADSVVGAVSASELIVPTVLLSKPTSFLSSNITCVPKSAARLAVVLFHETIDIAQDPSGVFVGVRIEGCPFTVEVKGDDTFQQCSQIRHKLEQCFGVMQAIAWLGGGSKCTVESVQAAINSKAGIDVASLHANTRELILAALPSVEVVDTTIGFTPTRAHSLVAPLLLDMTSAAVVANNIVRHKPECASVLPQLWAGIEEELANAPPVTTPSSAKAPRGNAKATTPGKVPAKAPATKAASGKASPPGKASPVAKKAAPKKAAAKAPKMSVAPAAAAAPAGFRMIGGTAVPLDLIEDDDVEGPVTFTDDDE